MTTSTSRPDMPEALRRAAAADGKTELFNLPGYPLMVRAVDFNRVHAESEMRRAALLDEMQKAALAAGPATAAQQRVAYAGLPEPSYEESGDSENYRPAAYSEYDLYDFADATHALRASHGQAPAGAVGWWRKRADEIERQVAFSGSSDVMRVYTDMRTLLQSVASQAAPQQETQKPMAAPQQETQKPMAAPQQETQKPMAAPQQETQKPMAGHEQETQKPMAGHEQETQKPMAGHEQETQKPMAGHEQARAIREGNEIAASEEYFAARPQIVSADRRKVFQAGFERGWDAARAAQEGK